MYIPSCPSYRFLNLGPQRSQGSCLPVMDFKLTLMLRSELCNQFLFFVSQRLEVADIWVNVAGGRELGWFLKPGDHFPFLDLSIPKCLP
jgi:hypothetical protein